MKKLIALSIVALCTAGMASATDTSSITLKNKSSFTMEGSNRNPFWPIGWKPVVNINQGNHVEAEIQATAFLVSSIAIQREGRFAIINGRVMQEGQEFGLQMGGQTYQVTLRSIEDGSVILAQHDREIVVQLRRK